MIRAEHVTVRAGARLLVNDVSLTMRPGTVTALVGPNGAGKSTFLKALSGDVAVESGDILVLDQSLSAWQPKSLARHRGVLPQDSGLTFPFTVLDVVVMGRAPHLAGFAESRRDYEIANNALAAVGLAGFEERLYPTLSGGERQRVQLARVLAQIWEDTDGRGRALLLDEPVSSLDLAQQQRVLLLARQFAQEGVAVLVILHDLNLAAQYADVVALMRDGTLIATGSPDEVLTTDVVHQVFGITVQVLPHPCHACPLVVSVPGIPTSLTA